MINTLYPAEFNDIVKKSIKDKKDKVISKNQMSVLIKLEMVEALKQTELLGWK